MLQNQVIGDDASTDQVFLDDSLEHGRFTAAVPRAFGIDNRNWAARANPQAIRLGAKHTALAGQVQFGQSRLQILPSFQRPLLVAALGDRLVAAEEDVALNTVDAQIPGNSTLGV
jgi:hypothetical protein